MNVSWQMFETCLAQSTTFLKIGYCIQMWHSRGISSHKEPSERVEPAVLLCIPVLLPDTPTCRCKKQLVHVKTSVSASLTRYVHTHTKVTFLHVKSMWCNGAHML